ncbi:MAG: acyl-CoA carboxylase subunit beta, partial [Myxococcales bacterium]|nr:acyl-CoA carboxylase subunit beta [Myxococcales bacterium]
MADENADRSGDRSSRNPRAALELREHLSERYGGPTDARGGAKAAARVEARAAAADEKLAERGRQTARQRIDSLLDDGSFVELDRYVTQQCQDFGMQDKKVYGDGVVTGYGTIDGRKVFVFAQQPAVWGGSLGWAHAMKICKVMDLAMTTGAPVIGLNDSGGARIQEGVASLAGYAEIFKRNVLASGVVPQISLILGPCAGGAVYSPALTDMVLMVEESSYMFITGPDVIRAVTHEEVTKEELGGARTHNEKSGVAQFACPSEAAAMAMTRELLGYFPGNNMEDPPKRPTSDAPDRLCPGLKDLVPTDSTRPYDIRQIITAIADDSRFLEVHEHFAKNMVVGFLHVDGSPVGVVANQPLVLAGCLDINASVKAARFVRTCDAFNIPILTLVDVPSIITGVQQELNGIIKHGAKLLFA